MKKIKLLTALTLLSLSVFAQRTITGTITDEVGNPVPNASVTIKGSTTGVTSDVNGNFRISVGNNDRTLIISYVGKADREVTIGESSVINISLRPVDNSLQEVVVVAYGNQVRKKVTGSIGKLPGKDLENVPMASLDKMLQGKIAGLQSVAPTGQPGSIQQVRIRGIGSISASSAPLYVIDGVPLNTGDASDLTQSSNLLAGINPNDIENISVLKDASAASIYGSRGANGVILITTKKGKAGKTRIRIDGEFGSSDRAYAPDMGEPLTKSELQELVLEGIENLGLPSNVEQAYKDFFLESYGFNSTASYDWLDLVTRRGDQQQVNVSASGGDSKSQFFISGGYFNQQSPVIGSELKRYNANLNLNHEINKRLALGINLNLSTFRQVGQSEAANFRNPVLAAMGLRPSQEAYNPDGTFNYGRDVFDQIFNPLAIDQYDKHNNQTSKLLGSAYLEYKIIDNLKLSSRYGVDYNTLEEYIYQNPYFGDARTTQGYAANNYKRISNMVWTNLADYSFTALDNELDGTVTVGYEAQLSKTYAQFGDGTVVPRNQNLDFPVPAIPTTANVGGSDYAFTSLLSRAQVNYLGRYSLSASLRRDGSSRFGTNNRYGTFWSVGAAWNIDQESFMQESEIFSALKLRASYGVNGNAGIGNYDWRTSFAFTTSYNGVPGSFQTSVGNPNLTWEQNKPLDIGLEIGLLKNRVIVETDYYTRKTENLLLNEPLSATSGFLTYPNNIGAMENKGFEVTIHAVPVKTKDFNWNISLNASWNKNTVTKLREDATEIVGNPFTIKVGEDVQSYYVRQWAGADPDNGDPLWYRNAAKTETTNDFTQAERVIVGSASPKGFGGMTNTFTYKFITLDAQFNYQYGNYIYNQWDFIFLGDGAFFGLNNNRKQLQRWQKAGDITDVPAYVAGNGSSSNEVSTRYLYKGDFIRLRNVTLGFELPSSLTEKIHVSKINIYLRGTNLWTKAFDKNITMDPEQPIDGLSDLQFFIPRTFTAGINIQL